MIKREAKNLVRVKGDHNYSFELGTESSNFYLASNLVAEAKDPESGLNLPIKCRWFGIRGEKVYNLNMISGNVYQLSAEDVACKVRVICEPLDDEMGWTGSAEAVFGPVALEPSMRQMLEYILGSGGARFPVTIMYPDDRHMMTEERKSREGALMLTDEKLTLLERGHVNHSKTIFSIEYTSYDEPAVNITSNDTGMLTLDYQDPEDVGQGLSFTLDLGTSTRRERDLIALAVKCYKALNLETEDYLSLLNLEGSDDEGLSSKEAGKRQE